MFNMLRPVFDDAPSRSDRNLLGIVLVGLLATLVPFAILGSAFEDRLMTLVRMDWPPIPLFAVVTGLLMADILLPVPSSAVNTYAGANLGFVLGTASSWIGLTAGACLGFAVARRMGVRLPGSDRESRDGSSPSPPARAGVEFILLVSRPLPIVAEACVISLGMTRLEWRRFLGPVLLGNLFVAAGYAAAGRWFAESETLVVVLLLSALMPLGLALAVRQKFNDINAGKSSEQSVV